MRAPAPSTLLSVLALLALACGQPVGPPAPAPTRSRLPAAPRFTLTAPDVQTYLQVHARALQRLEAMVAQAEARNDPAVLQEPGVEEQRAAGGMGVDWGRYEAVRQEIARLVSMQRQREDSRLLVIELTKARDDLAGQLKAARDPASRQFLEAQIATLGEHLARIDREWQPTDAEREELALLESVRAELAVQQGRQDRVLRRMRDLLQKAVRARTTPTAIPEPSR